MKFVEMNKLVPVSKQKVFNLLGEDDFLIRQAIINFKNMFIKDLEEFDFVKIDCDKLKLSDIEPQLLTLPIGNEFRLVVLSNLGNELIKQLNKYDISKLSCVLVCVNALGLEIGEVVDCSKLDKAYISKYILHNLSKVNLRIQEQAMDYLVDSCGMDMYKVNNELNKIISFCLNNTDTITMETVINLVTNSNEYAIFSLTNAIDKKDFGEYQSVLNQLLKTLSSNEIFSFLGKYFRRMQYISLNKNDEELSSILAIKPYAIKMSRQNIAKNGIKFYINLYQKYVDLDYKIKSGEITALNALYELIF